MVLASCSYSFVGGGLPPHIRTLSVASLSNETAQPVLATDIQQELEARLPRNLGVRLVGAANADAVVRGRVVGYEETVPGFRTGGAGGRVDIVQSEVRITMEVEIYDLRQDRVLWRNQTLAAVGQYQPDEQALTGRGRAIEQLVNKVIQGAQSQW
ncbi:MAG: LPS assembly lipoprotein LptE [Gemmatimonadota bacterium]|jgi:hypothetical protein|nr:LPS assembly lipoprotein LptE [Gemmatimonadota bacterium]